MLGTRTLDRKMSTFDGTCKWMGKEVRISLDVEIEKKSSGNRVANVMKKLVADQEVWGEGQFELMTEESTCPLKKVKTEDDTEKVVKR